MRDNASFCLLLAVAASFISIFQITLLPRNLSNDHAITLPNFTKSGGEAKDESAVDGRILLGAANNNNSINSNNHTETRPILVLHIGPHKTATSTLQCELTFFRGLLLHSSSKEKFIYLGRSYKECRAKTALWMDNKYNLDPRPAISCLNGHTPNNSCKQRKEWKKFEQQLQSTAKAGLNAVISDEAFTDMKVNEHNLELLFQTIQKHFRLRLVIVYRHYFSWIVSLYNEIMKHDLMEPKNEKWPGEGGGSEVQTFLGWYYSRQDYRLTLEEDPSAGEGTPYFDLAAEWNNLHIVAYLKKRWSNPLVPKAPRLEDVFVLDMHEFEGSNDDVTVNFVEQVISSDLAMALKERKAELKKAGKRIPSRNNPSMNHDLDMLAIEAHKSGILPNHPKLNRRFVANQINKRFHLETGIALREVPSICPDQNQIQQLQNRTLFLEETVFGNQSAKRQQQHKTDFDYYSKGGKFCHVNAKKVLENEKVQKFFQSLIPA